MAHWAAWNASESGSDAAAGLSGRASALGLAPSQGARLRLDPANVRNGLVRLVLTLIELLRELLERQACAASTAARSPTTRSNGSA